MKRSRTLASYFPCVSITQLNEVDEPPAPSVPKQATDPSHSPPPSQGTEQGTIGTRISAAQTQLNQFNPLAQEETIRTRTSVVVVGQATVGIEASN